MNLPKTFKEIFEFSVGISLFIVIMIIATPCWFIEHSYNFLTGKGWSGLALWIDKNGKTVIK